jgi:hypothetical protein
MKLIIERQEIEATSTIRPATALAGGSVVISPAGRSRRAFHEMAFPALNDRPAQLAFAQPPAYNYNQMRGSSM